MTMKCLVLADIDKRIIEEFSDISFDFLGYAVSPHNPLKHVELLDIIPEYDFMISEFDSIDKEVIDKAVRLKMIICARGGVASVVDIPYALKKGILVKNMPGRNANSVAEYVMGVIISDDRYLYKASELVLKGVLQQERYLLPDNYKDSLWGMDSDSPYRRFRGRGLRNITLGVVGYGNVGRVVVRYAISLGMHVSLYDHHRVMNQIPSGVTVVRNMEELLEMSDYISLHCTNRTHEVLMGEREFSKMHRNAFFINTARGDLVDEDALCQALNENRIRGAVLDVTRNEPLPNNSKIIGAKNIMITPHIAGASEEVTDYCTDMSIYYLREYLSNFIG